MTYREICARLRDAGIEDAAWETQLLLERFCGANTLSVLAEQERDWGECDTLRAAVERRCNRYPLQYLIGEWTFYRQCYEVSPDCLIPRSDTEILVEQAIKLLPQEARFADLCTGSGCIAVSALAERPDTRAVAVDKFENTLALATRNAEKNKVRDRFVPLCADVLRDLSLPDGFTSLDAILCNPPYIPTAVLATLAPELTAEPSAALDGGADGLIFYRALLQRAAKHLKPNGFFLFEIGYDQADALRGLGAEYGFLGYECRRDLGGNDRVVRLWK